MNESTLFSKMHTKSLYGQAPKLKINREKFQSNSSYAHLIGRAFACEKIIERHKLEPYESVDVLLGDLQIELTTCMNKFREKALFHKSDKFHVEQFI